MQQVQVPNVPTEAIREYVRHWIRMVEVARVVSPGQTLFEVQMQKFQETAFTLQRQVMGRRVRWAHVFWEARRQFDVLSRDVHRDPAVTQAVEHNLDKRQLPHVTRRWS